ncbi:hypothetical protein L7F22_009478, partial [Adiantum nelumboides]|nr:hypothetical protein [Adiantum nelumboides]
HRKECKLISDPSGFLIYLHCLYNELSEDPTQVITEHVLDLDDAGQTKVLEEDSDFEQKQHPNKDVTEDLCIEEEAKQVMVLTHKELRQRIEKVPLQGPALDAKQAYMLLPMLPKFHIEGKSYILLTDVQMLFDLHEDYALGMLARYINEQHGFVEQDSSDDERLETNTNALECLQYCFKKAREYKRSGVPSESTFKSLQDKMQLDKCSDSAKKWMEKQGVKERQSIDLYQIDVFMADKESE